MGVSGDATDLENLSLPTSLQLRVACESRSSMFMQITTYQPHDPLLRAYISYYYQQEYTPTNTALGYQCFPHLNLSISLFQRAYFHFEQGASFVTYHPESKPLSLLTLVRSRPLWVNHQGPLRKIAIVFEPLGLQTLCQQSLARLVCQPVTAVDPFGGQLTQLIPRLFATASGEERVAVLDHFFLRLIQPCPYSALPELVVQTSQPVEPLPLQHIAQQHQLSRRHMTRLFQHYLGCSPETYRQIARFRRGLQLATQSPQPLTLTQLAHQSGHADQAHWNKQCRKWTGYAPGDLLSRGTSLTPQALFWRLTQSQ